MKTSKLIVRLKGGLGNQLFCYATARRLALKSGAELVLDDVTGFKYDKLYQRQYALGDFSITARKASYLERLEPFGRIRRFLKKCISSTQPLNKKRYIVQSSVAFQEEILSLKLQPGMTYFDGFGQSERYFSDIESILREDLTIQSAQSVECRKYLSGIENCGCAVAIHMRWFEANVNSSSNVSVEYYSKAIEYIKQHTKYPHFYIFSENIEVSEQILASCLLSNEYTTVRTNTSNPIEDFFLMQKCNHFIIGNSTFAWWAAWLGEDKKSSIIVSPEIMVDPNLHSTAWGFDYLIPERWNIL